MSFLNQAKSKRLLSVHGWSGTVLGLLLYICLFTGSIVVFEDEIDSWSQGIVAHHSTLSPQTDHRFRVAARAIDPVNYEDITLFRTSEGHMQYTFHTHGKDPETGEIVETGVRLLVEPETGAVLDRQEGKLEDFPRAPGDALRDFWVDLHVQLYLPDPYGLVLVTVLGLMMMSAALSGLLLHKHLVRDAFLAARDRNRLVGARDLHVLAASWALPFAVILAFTGVFFGFAGSLGIPMMAKVAFNGDQVAMLETLFGHEEPADLSPAPLASLDYILAEARTRAGTEPFGLQITHYGSQSAEVTVFMTPQPGQLSGVSLEFAGVSRAFIGERPLIGQAPSVGGGLLSVMGPLHFGDFAGLASKAVWLGMGMAMSFVTASGLLLWTKRRESSPLWRRFHRAIGIVIWGLPFAMLLSAGVFFLTLPAGDTALWTPLGFLLGCMVAVGLGVRPPAQPNADLRFGTALLCLGLPLLRHLTGGASWSEALLGGGAEILTIDLLLIACGLVLLRPQLRGQSSDAAHQVRNPAE